MKPVFIQAILRAQNAVLSEHSSRNIFYRYIGTSGICLFRLADVEKMASAAFSSSPKLVCGENGKRNIRNCL